MGGARQHAVFSREPAGAFAFQEWRNPLFYARRAYHTGVSELDKHRPFRMFSVMAGQFYSAQFVRFASAGSHGA